MFSTLLFLTLGLQSAKAAPKNSSEKTDKTEKTEKSEKRSESKKQNKETTGKAKSKSQSKVKDRSKGKTSPKRKGAKPPQKQVKGKPEYRNNNSQQDAGDFDGMHAPSHSGPKHKPPKQYNHKPEKDARPQNDRERPSQGKKPQQSRPQKDATPPRVEKGVPQKKGQKVEKPQNGKKPPKKYDGPQQSKPDNNKKPPRKGKNKPNQNPKQKGVNQGKGTTVPHSVFVPKGWDPKAHRLEPNNRFSKTDPRRWGAGVLAYNPPKKKEVKVAPYANGKQIGKAQRIRRNVNRNGQISLGVQGLNYWSGYTDGKDYIDPGLGISLGIRKFEFLGAEISAAQFSDSVMMQHPERLNQPFQAVGQIYLFPWTKVSPFVSAGVAANALKVQDTYQWKGNQKQAKQNSLLLGTVLGAGVEFNVAKHFGLKAEGRYFDYRNLEKQQPANNNAVLISMGMSLYF
jgi:opacity protein-like surface antigen